jgi:hypothetical protein
MTEVCVQADSLTLNIEAVHSSEVSVYLYKSAWCHISNDGSLYSQLWECLICYALCLIVKNDELLHPALQM